MITQEDVDNYFDNQEPVSHSYDCEKIKEIARRELGIRITRKQAEQIWEKYSYSMAAGWLGVDDENEVISAIRCFFI